MQPSQKFLRQLKNGLKDVDTFRLTHQARIHDAEVEAKLVTHLVPPLDLQGGGTHHENLPGTMPDDKFQPHHARFDSFAKANVVSDQQVDPRHLDRPHYRIKLVVLDFDTAAERRLDVLVVGGGCGTQADGIEKGVELVGRIEVGRFGERHPLDDLGPRLDFPKDLQFFPQPVVLH